MKTPTSLREHAAAALQKAVDRYDLLKEQTLANEAERARIDRERLAAMVEIAKLREAVTRLERKVA